MRVLLVYAFTPPIGHHLLELCVQGIWQKNTTNEGEQDSGVGRGCGRGGHRVITGQHMGLGDQMTNSQIATET